MFVKWTEKEVWEGEVRTQQRVPGLFTWKLRTGTASLSPLLVSIQLEVLQSPGGGRLLGGEVNMILSSFQVFDFKLPAENIFREEGTRISNKVI